MSEMFLEIKEMVAEFWVNGSQHFAQFSIRKRSVFWDVKSILVKLIDVLIDLEMMYHNDFICSDGFKEIMPYDHFQPLPR